MKKKKIKRIPLKTRAKQLTVSETSLEKLPIPPCWRQEFIAIANFVREVERQGVFCKDDLRHKVLRKLDQLKGRKKKLFARYLLAHCRLKGFIYEIKPYDEGLEKLSKVKTGDLLNSARKGDEQSIIKLISWDIRWHEEPCVSKYINMVSNSGDIDRLEALGSAFTANGWHRIDKSRKGVSRNEFLGAMHAIAKMGFNPIPNGMSYKDYSEILYRLGLIDEEDPAAFEKRTFIKALEKAGLSWKYTNNLVQIPRKIVSPPEL